MPELAEVKIISDQIKPLVFGKQIINAIPGNTGRYRQNNPEGFEDFLKEITLLPKVVEVRTHGKLMIWDFSNDFHMLCNFGMTGRWICQDVQLDMEKHACFSLDLNDGKRIVFLDPRHFGSIKFIRGQEKVDQKLAALGWDCLQQELTEQVLLDISCKLKGNRVIGSDLLDQSIF
jgi:formamidopyrimidine-DNA glycosylase